MSDNASNNALLFSLSPHVRSKFSTRSIMLEVIFSLVPVLVFACLQFGLRVLLLVGISVVSAVVSEFVWEKLTKRPVTIFDFSAVLTGLLLAFNLPVDAPWWIPLVGAAFAIILVKQLFGGLGYNFMNPALAGRCFLLLSWSKIMTTFTDIDGVTSATPLTLIKEGSTTELPTLFEAFIGKTGGCIGETSAILILIGGIYLIARQIIDFRIPLSYLATVFLMSLCFGLTAEDSLYQLCVGGVMLGAFYMATDYVTTPMSKLGKWIFGLGCGVMTVLIRQLGAYPEGVSFSILFMNVCTPLIDRFTKPRVFGIKRFAGKEKKA